MPDLASEFDLTEEELQRRLPTGGQTYFANRCHWAKFYLSRAGLLEAARRGFFVVTDEGRNILTHILTEVRDRKSLTQIPQFAKWWQEAPESKGARVTAGPAAEVTDADATTPDERIDTAARLLEGALEADLLASIRTVPPSKFEQIVVDLLNDMGLGGGDPEMGQRLGRTGNGGINGVIQADALGIDAVYVQAKRYKDGANIGASTIREFVGSLVRIRATKGVFITGSKFTADASEFAKSVQHRIVLIDGEELARLLVRHGVAVREDRHVVIKKFDEDYFSGQGRCDFVIDLPVIATACSILARCSAGQGQALRVAAEEAASLDSALRSVLRKSARPGRKDATPAEQKDRLKKEAKGWFLLDWINGRICESSKESDFTPYAPLVLTPAPFGELSALLLLNKRPHETVTLWKTPR